MKMFVMVMMIDISRMFLQFLACKKRAFISLLWWWPVSYFFTLQLHEQCSSSSSSMLQVRLTHQFEEGLTIGVHLVSAPKKAKLNPGGFRWPPSPTRLFCITIINYISNVQDPPSKRAILSHHWSSTNPGAQLGDGRSQVMIAMMMVLMFMSMMVMFMMRSWKMERTIFNYFLCWIFECVIICQVCPTFHWVIDRQALSSISSFSTLLPV